MKEVRLIGPDRKIANENIIAQSSVVFEAGDNLTTEKKTSAIPLLGMPNEKDTYYIYIDKPTENTAGDMQVDIYDMVKTDGTNERESWICSFSVEKITDAATYRKQKIEGMFGGEGKIKLGMSFATDSGAITVPYMITK